MLTNRPQNSLNTFCTSATFMYGFLSLKKKKNKQKRKERKNCEIKIFPPISTTFVAFCQIHQGILTAIVLPHNSFAREGWIYPFVLLWAYDRVISGIPVTKHAIFLISWRNFIHAHAFETWSMLVHPWSILVTSLIRFDYSRFLYSRSVFLLLDIHIQLPITNKFRISVQ